MWLSGDQATVHAYGPTDLQPLTLRAQFNSAGDELNLACRIAQYKKDQPPHVSDRNYPSSEADLTVVVQVRGITAAMRAVGVFFFSSEHFDCSTVRRWFAGTASPERR